MTNNNNYESTLFEALNNTFEAIVKDTFVSIKNFIFGEDIIEADLKYVSHMYDEMCHHKRQGGFDLQRFAAPSKKLQPKTSFLGALGWLVVDPSDLFITVNGVRRSLCRVWFIIMLALALLLAHVSCTYASPEQQTVQSVSISVYGIGIAPKSVKTETQAMALAKKAAVINAVRNAIHEVEGAQNGRILNISSEKWDSVKYIIVAEVQVF